MAKWHGFRSGRKKTEKLRRRKIAREITEKARIEKLKAAGKWVNRLQLGKVAKELIQKYDLPANRQGKSILRLELKMGLLKSRKPMKVRENIFLSLIADAGKIKLSLWLHRIKPIPLQEAYEACKAYARILDRAELAATDEASRKKFADEGAIAAEAAEQVKNELARNTIGSVLLGNKEKMLAVADMGERIANNFFAVLPEDTRIALQAVDKIVERAFGREKQ